MPQCRLVLLVLLMFAGLWTSPQGTQAQTGCPEGGCKVFLPVVHSNTLATANVTYVLSSRYCSSIYVGVAVTNVSIEPITQVQIRGSVTEAYGDRVLPFADTTQDVLFPGETNRYSYTIPTGQGQICGGEDSLREVRIVGASTVPQFRTIDVVSRTLIQESVCNGAYTYRAFGRIRNNNPVPLSNPKIFLILGGTELFINVDQPTVAPGESVEFTTQFHTNHDDDPHTPCTSEDHLLPQEMFNVRSWGEAIP